MIAVRGCCLLNYFESSAAVLVDKEFGFDESVVAVCFPVAFPACDGMRTSSCRLQLAKSYSNRWPVQEY